jgi:BirA family biotin operon repressor/biotin-[acetyl-CoA-carboxylase] ligase
MIILTDSISFAQDCIPHEQGWQECGVFALPPGIQEITRALFETGPVMLAEAPGVEYWDYLFAVGHARHSQYDALAELAVAGLEFPGRVLCCARTGERFHGFKNRDWRACSGNIHLSAAVVPATQIDGGAAGFIAAAVVSALETVDAFDLGDAETGIKWVNDLLVNGAKVGGVLARLQTQGAITKSAVLGIGLNVEQRPSVERDPYVPKVAALADFATAPDRCRHADVFPRLADSLGRNLAVLIDGGFEQMLEAYRQHSLVLNRKVTVLEDKRGANPGVIARGMVEAIGPELELHIGGHASPVTKGRVIINRDGPTSGHKG